MHIEITLTLELVKGEQCRNKILPCLKVDSPEKLATNFTEHVCSKIIGD